MKQTSYRLGEYEIIEMSDGGIWWKAHSGFGSAAGGTCFIEGNIIFISPPIETDDSGFLKNEFLAQLRSLPIWNKTKFYCTKYEIHSCEAAKIPREKRSRPPVDPACCTLPNVAPPISETDYRSSQDCEPEPDDFDLFLKNDTVNLAEIGESVARRFRAVASKIKKLRFRK